MSKISIFVDGAEAPLDFLMAVKRISGVAPTDLGKMIEHSRPIWEVYLFENDHDEIAEDLKRLVDIAAASGIPLRLYELPADEEWSDLTQLEVFRIDEETLRNILD